MKIFANHAHTFPTEIKPEADHDSLRRYLDECGIDKCVAFSCFNKLIIPGTFIFAKRFIYN